MQKNDKVKKTLARCQKTTVVVTEDSNKQSNHLEHESLTYVVSVARLRASAVDVRSTHPVQQPQ